MRKASGSAWKQGSRYLIFIYRLLSGRLRHLKERIFIENQPRTLQVYGIMDERVKTVAELMDIYCKSVGRNGHATSPDPCSNPLR